MSIDFNKIIDRSNTRCMKWDSNKNTFGSDDILPMWIADMDFEAPEPVYKALKKRLDHKVYGYTYRDESYNQTIIHWVKRRYNWDIKDEWITFSPGIVPALSMSILGNTKPGDKVIIMTPVYGPFFDVVLTNGRLLTETRLVNKDGYYTIDFEDLESKIDSKTKVIMICNPHNPAGRVWNESELKKIADLAIKYDLLIISDEIHADFIYSGHKHIPIATLSEEVASRTISCYAPSKTFGLAGLTTSFIVIPDKKVRNNFNDILTSLEIDGGNIFGMVGLQAAYTDCDYWLEELLIYLESNRDYAVDYINKFIPELKVFPSEGTYLLWLNCKDLGFNTSNELLEFFVKKAKLGLNRGIRFESQSDQFMRLNFACPRSILEKGLKQLSSAIKNI